MQNFSYLFHSSKKLLLREGLACPSCGGQRNEVVERKYLVTSLRRCADCKLLFRAPTTTEAENERIYQNLYTEGFTTALPSDEQLKELLVSNFSGNEKDYSTYIEVLRALGVKPGARLFDFGCSWGYGSWQLDKAGFAVDAYEISKPRANYAASKLGVKMIEPGQIAPETYDVFFSSHVIEHVPSVSQMIGLGMKALKPGGLFIAFSPNGSLAWRQHDPAGFHSSWGFVHPQLIDWDFLLNLKTFDVIIADSQPYSCSELRKFTWDKKLSIRLDGNELMFSIKKSS